MTKEELKSKLEERYPEMMVYVAVRWSATVYGADDRVLESAAGLRTAEELLAAMPGVVRV